MKKSLNMDLLEFHIREAAWEKIREFAARGGRVVYLGGAPQSTFASTLTQTRPIEPIDGALLVADSTWTAELDAYLPARDMLVSEGRSDSLVCCARQTADSRIFFLLNQKGEAKDVTLDLDAMGEAQLWDAATGEIHALPFTVTDGRTRVRLHFDAWQSHIVVVRKRTATYDARRYKNIQAAIDRAHSEGGGTVVLKKGRHRTGALFFPRGVDLHLDRGATLVSIVDTLAQLRPQRGLPALGRGYHRRTGPGMETTEPALRRKTQDGLFRPLRRGHHQRGAHPQPGVLVRAHPFHQRCYSRRH